MDNNSDKQQMYIRTREEVEVINRMGDLGATTQEVDTEPAEQYYISETGVLWSPMTIVGSVIDSQAKVIRHIMSGPSSIETLEISVEWFEAHKADLLIVDGWSVAGKPNLQSDTASLAQSVNSRYFILGSEMLKAANINSVKQQEQGKDLIN